MEKEFIRVTEQPSHFRHLENMSVQELLVNINNEDKMVPLQWKKQFLRLIHWCRRPPIKC